MRSRNPTNMRKQIGKSGKPSKKNKRRILS